MNSPLAFIVVEDRRNKALLLCRESAALAGEQLIVLSGTDAGPDYARFRDAYVHLSSNSPEFEMVCFRRYFLLAKYLAAHPECRRFVLIDSDVCCSGASARTSGTWPARRASAAPAFACGTGGTPARYRRTSATGHRRGFFISSPTCSTPTRHPGA